MAVASWQACSRFIVVFLISHRCGMQLSRTQLSSFLNAELTLPVPLLTQSARGLPATGYFGRLSREASLSP